MHIRETGRPVAVNVWHVLPRRERNGERVEQSLLWLVNLGDAKDIVNVGHHGKSSRRNQVRGGIANGRALNVGVESLNLGCLISGSQPMAGNWHECIEIAFRSGIIWQSDVLRAPRRVG